MNDKGSMVVRSVNGSIMEVFEITGFLSVLTVENETE
jgi:anti-anti-sigma regulatory factor